MYLISIPTQQQVNCYVNWIAFLKKLTQVIQKKYENKHEQQNKTFCSSSGAPNEKKKKKSFEGYFQAPSNV